MLEVVCAVLQRGERVLLCERAEGSHLAGHWEFPGGKVEPGEARAAALEREIAEELGCTVRATEELVAIEHCYPELAIRLHPIRCVLVNGEPAALEHRSLGWFLPSEWPALDLAEADRKVAAQLILIP